MTLEIYSIVTNGKILLQSKERMVTPMNETELWLGAQFFHYQKSRGGLVHPKEIIEALEGQLKNWRWSYGENGEKVGEPCPRCGYYCECGK